MEETKRIVVCEDSGFGSWKLIVTDANNLVVHLQWIFNNIFTFDWLRIDVKVADAGTPDPEYEIDIWCNNDEDEVHVDNFFVPESVMKSLSTEKIYDIISKYTYLKTLVIKSSVAPLILFEQISLLLKETQNIDTLSLSVDSVSDEQMRLLCDGVSNSKTLKHLLLSGKEVTSNGENMFVKTILSLPHLHLERVDFSFKNSTDHGKETTENVGRLNVLVKNEHGKNAPKRFKNLYFVCDSIRSYDLPNGDLAGAFTFYQESQQFQEFKSVASVFIYNSPIDLAFLQKWFNEDGIGASLETVALIGCGAPAPNEFFLHPDNAGKFPKLKIINITESAA